MFSKKEIIASPYYKHNKYSQCIAGHGCLFLVLGYCTKKQKQKQDNCNVSFEKFVTLMEQRKCISFSFRGKRIRLKSSDVAKDVPYPAPMNFFTIYVIEFLFSEVKNCLINPALHYVFFFHCNIFKKNIITN